MESTDIWRTYSMMCRLCLQKDGFMLGIFNHLQGKDKSISKKIMDCTALQISEKDGLPNVICHRCLYKIEFCLDFREQCFVSDATLRQVHKSTNAHDNDDSHTNHNMAAFEHLIDNDQKTAATTSTTTTTITAVNNQKNNDINEDIVMVVDPNSVSYDEPSEYLDPQSEPEDITHTINLNATSNTTIASTTATTNTTTQPIILPTALSSLATNTSPLTANVTSHSMMSVHHNNSSKLITSPAVISNVTKNVSMCRYCDYAFTSKNACVEHELTAHDSLTPYTCAICTMRFADRFQYSAHLKTVHQHDKPYACPQCERTFARRSDLRKHTVVHTGVKPYTCAVCTKSFSRNTNLSKHMRIHSGQKPFVCAKCPKTFFCKGDLTRHALVHTGARPFWCTYCPLTFSRRDKLLRHEKRHNLEENNTMIVALDPLHFQQQQQQQQQSQLSISMVPPLQPLQSRTPSGGGHVRGGSHVCGECGKRFTRKRELERHSAVHTGQRPFKCEKCTKMFSRKDRLVQHAKIHEVVVVKKEEDSFVDATCEKDASLDGHRQGGVEEDDEEEELEEEDEGERAEKEDDFDEVMMDDDDDEDVKEGVLEGGEIDFN